MKAKSRLACALILAMLTFSLFCCTTNQNSAAESPQESQYGVELSCNNTTGTINGSGYITYSITITNTGTIDDTINLYAGWVNLTGEGAYKGKWNFKLDKESVTLAAGELANVTLFVASPCCQEEVVANISVAAVSAGNNSVWDFVITTTDVPIFDDVEIPPGGDICISIFYSPGCAECYEAREFLRKMKEENPELRVMQYNAADPYNETLKQTYFEHYGVPLNERGSLGVFIGDKCFTSASELKSDLENEVAKYPDGCPCPEISANDSIVIDTFKSFGVLGIAIAGLADGINPCAFATLVFFISYLAVAGKDGRMIFCVGLSFAAGVFLAYLLMGIALYRAASAVADVSALSALLYPITGIVALAFGALSAYDYFKIKQGKHGEATLQLPNGIKRLTRKIVRKQMKSSHLALSAALAGAIISALEFMCTGQVYLPTIVYIIGVPGYEMHALSYLLIYNIMFIVPIFVIFAAAYFGASSQAIRSFFQRNAALSKALLAGVFFLLAVAMFFIGFF